MQRSMLVAPSLCEGAFYVLLQHGDALTLLADRIANGDAFPAETVVRVPRRIVRALLRGTGTHVSAGHFRSFWLRRDISPEATEAARTLYGATI